MQHLRWLVISNTTRHIGIVVNDLEKTKDFWINTIGFKLHIEAMEESPFIDELLAINDPALTTVKLIDSKGFIIELLKFENYEVGNSWSGDLKTTGLTHIALTVDNLDELVVNLKSKIINQFQRLKHLQTKKWK